MPCRPSRRSQHNQRDVAICIIRLWWAFLVPVGGAGNLGNLVGHNTGKLLLSIACRIKPLVT